MSFNTLMPRVATGVLLLALLGFSLYMGHTWLSCLAFVFAALALWEFLSLFWPGRERLSLKITGIALCAFLIAASWFGALFLHILGWNTLAVPLSLLVAGMVLAIIFLIHFSIEETTANMGDNALVLFGLVYTTVPLMLALQLGLAELLLLFAVTIAADTCAYAAGNVWGRHKIWPKVSPKKSVEGCAGGLVGTVIVCVAFEVYNGSGRMSLAVLTGVILAVSAMMGDFFESALKRRQGVKDSGTLLPGHGGVLDRLDSFLFVVPAYHVIQFLVSLNH